MYRLQVKTHFDAAHFIKDYSGKCKRMHGHRWEVEVCLQGELKDIELTKMNMLIDFSDVKKMMNSLIERLDHHVLNEQLRQDNVTAEFLAKWFFDEMIMQLANCGYHFSTIELVRVCIWESPDCCVKYSPSMKSTNEVS